MFKEYSSVWNGLGYLRQLMMLLLLVPAVPLMLGGTDIGAAVLYAIIFAVISGLLYIKRSELNIKKGAFWSYLALSAAFLISSIFVSINTFESLIPTALILLGFTAITAGAWLFKEYEAAKFYMDSLLLLSVPFAIYGIVTYVRYQNLDELFSTFGWPNPAAGYLLLTIPYALWRYLETKRLTYLALTVPGLTALFLTFSRAGILALVLAGIFGVVASREKKAVLTRILPIFLLSLILAFAAVQVRFNGSSNKGDSGRTAESVLTERVATPSIAVSSAADRISYYKASWSEALRYPVFGVGPGNFGSVYPQYQTSAGSTSRYAHSVFFETLVGTGFVGLFALLAFLGVLYLGIKDKGINARTLPFLLPIAAVLIHSAVDFDFRYPSIFIPFLTIGSVFLRGKIWASTRLLGLALLGISGTALLFSYSNADSRSTTRLAVTESRVSKKAMVEIMQTKENALFTDPDLLVSIGKTIITNEQFGPAKERLSQGLSYADRAIELDPRNARAYQLRARSLGALDRLPEAREAIEKAYELNRFDYPEIHTDLALAYIASGDRDRAVRVLNELIEIYPENVVIGRGSFLKSVYKDMSYAYSLLSELEKERANEYSEVSRRYLELSKS